MNDLYTDVIKFYDNHPEQADFYEEVIEGLKSQPRKIPPKFFYDEKGSRLFDQICKVPEYYVTRTECKILIDNVEDISDVVGSGCMLLEPGSGSSEKVRLLLDKLKPETYVPMDISRNYLLDVARQVSEEYPWLDVHAACVDFTEDMNIPKELNRGRKVAFFPGSSIGNFEPEEAVCFLKNIAKLVGQGGGLLIGVDIKKPIQILHAAYNDEQGVTAEFNLNLLERINNELDGDFNLDNFNHCAHFDEDIGRIEMHLISLKDHEVTVGEETFYFKENETIHTECSYKYDVKEFQDLAQQAGFACKRVWQDAESLFSVHYYECL